MKIEGSYNLSILSEALSEHTSSLESRIMNHRFDNEAEKKLLIVKLRKARGLHSHIAAASISEQISNSLIIS